MLGMHRSGTSALTRGLEAMGVRLGDRLMPGAAGNNDSGFFEDVDVVALNDAILRKAGHVWHSLAPWDADVLSGPAFHDERVEAMALLRERLSAFDPFGLKDPRLCLTLPLWRCVFEDLGVQPSYVVCVRNPLEVAHSLHARDDFPIQKGLRLWAQHTAAVLTNLPEATSAFVHYAELLRAPAEVIADLAGKLDLEVVGEALETYATEFIDQSQRHEAVSDGELARSGKVQPDQLALYERLVEATKTGSLGDAPLPEARSEPEELLALVDEMDDRRRLIERRLAEDRQTIKRQEGDIEAARSETAAAEAAAAALQSVTDTLSARAEELAREAEERAAEAEERAQTISRLTREKEDVAQALTSLERSNAAELGIAAEKLEEAETVARRLEAELARSADAVASLEGDLDAARSEQQRDKEEWRRRAERDQDALRSARNALAAAEAKAAELSSAVSRLSRREQELTAVSSGLRRSLETLEGQHEKATQTLRTETLTRRRLRADLNAVRGSTSWRLTRPVRAAGKAVSGTARVGKAGAKGAASLAWHALPLPARIRGRLAGLLFRAAPALFRGTPQFAAWQAQRGRRQPRRRASPGKGARSGGAKDRPPAGAIVLALHDLNPSGAQMLTVALARVLKERFGYDVTILAAAPGALMAEAEAVSRVVIAAPERADRALGSLARAGCGIGIVTTAAAGAYAPVLSRAHIRCVGLIHEMEDTLRTHGLKQALADLSRCAGSLVFASTVVLESAARVSPVPQDKVVILPQGLYGLTEQDETDEASDRALVAETLFASRHGREAEGRRGPLPPYVVTAGHGDRRKGFDLWLAWAAASVAAGLPHHFVWLGDVEANLASDAQARLAREDELRQRVHLLGHRDDAERFLRHAALYALSSREDPFPSAALEAFAAGVPVVMVSGSSGLCDLAPTGLVHEIDGHAPERFASFLRAFPGPSADDIAAGQAWIAEHAGMTSYAASLLALLGAAPPAVSVVVPNYNYAQHIEARLSSILGQTLPPREIILLDDASTDDSLEKAKRRLSGCGISWRVAANRQNSGHVAHQWARGARLARHPLLWIAEADDLAEPEFLATATRAFAAPDIAISAVESRRIDEHGGTLTADSQSYVSHLSVTDWTERFTAPGQDMLSREFSVKNVLPNVSGALVRTDLLIAATAELASLKALRSTADWAVYARLLAEGGLAFDPSVLNGHRIHEGSVTKRNAGLRELSEVAWMQRRIAGMTAVPAERALAAEHYLRDLVEHWNLKRLASPDDLSSALSGRFHLA